MRVLFVMHYPGYLRYFDTTVSALAAAGHDVFVGFESERKQAEGFEALPTDDPRIHRIPPLPRRADIWAGFAVRLRSSIDFVRYLDPRLAEARYLRRRMALVLPRSLRAIDRIDRLPSSWVNALVKAYRGLEAVIPPPDSVVDWMHSVDPDVVLVSPLVTDASAQTDVVKAAHAVGVPVALLVASWDHLTTKGLIRVVPDRVVVWNAIQRREAVTLHGVPEERVVVTGAQPFDRWFSRQPRLSRQDFAARIGLPADPPFILFVGSTASISEPEAERTFVEAWLRALRAADDDRVRNAPVLVRPHPYNVGTWAGADLTEFGRVVVWPSGGANPVNEDDREEYFLSLRYAAAVVGINTSAMVEAAIQRRPVLTVRTEQFRETQDLTVHFTYLLPENGGFVRSAATLAQHLDQLAETLGDPKAGAADAERFVAAFLRPGGLDLEATPNVVAAIDQLLAEGRSAQAPTARAALRVTVLFAAAVVRVVDGMHVRRSMLRLTRQLEVKLDRAERRAVRGSFQRRTLHAAARVVGNGRRRLTVERSQR